MSWPIDCWNSVPDPGAPDVMVPDCTVNRKGTADEALKISIVMRPISLDPEALLFHMSKTTELALVDKSLLFNQNSTVTPLSKFVLRFDSRDPVP